MRDLRIAARALSLALILPLSYAKADTSADIRSTALDVERYLLLYSNGGDERFWTQMNEAQNQLGEQIKTEKGAATLEGILSTYQGYADDVRAAYWQNNQDLSTSLAQAFNVFKLLDSFLPADTSSQAPSLADNLRSFAVLSIRQDTPLAETGDQQTIDQLAKRISAQIDALSNKNPKAYQQVPMRWKYLQIAHRNGKPLIYPFNAQIEYMLAQLEAGSAEIP
ncbi:hypothetical protein [Pseudomonas sp. S9]|uniref:hypothetical protein n=1 Tax=Pseudomonas sp. S9 TaxID=686578 RepID=UPI0002557637|nr:hypothetical protein [Pseudomonas sp. S9]